MDKHTPGPWHIKGSYNIFSDKRTVASTGGYSDNHKLEETYNENVANARLIAAAPDMYEALTNLVAWHEKTAVKSAIDLNPNDMWEKARAAIAKARGQL